jgi:hypothetical protein
MHYVACCENFPIKYNITKVNGKEQFFLATYIVILHAEFTDFHAEVRKY